MEPFYTPINIHYALSSNNNIIPANNMNPPWMDSRIWSRLPHGLLERILACLPPPALFRSRSVCKRWYSLIFSTSFLDLYLSSSPRLHWFIFFNHQTTTTTIYKTTTTTTTSDNPRQLAFLFDPSSLKWYRLPCTIPSSGFSPASSSGGLTCWVSDEAGSKTILLFNPLTASLLQLPSTLRPRLCPSVGLSITPSSIHMAFAGDDMISPYAVKNLTSETFHIDTAGFYSIWGTTAPLPRLCSLESGRMLHAGARFYCMNYSPFSVLSYDVAANEWCKIQAPMRRFLRSPGLVESRGKVFLVAAVEKSKLNVPRSLRLWTLQDCGTVWVEIERMPQQLYTQFAEIEGGRGFSCVAHGDHVLILVKGESDKMLMFDFWGKRWVWVPPCPYVNNNGVGENELLGFAYEPRVAVPIAGLLEQLTLPFTSFSA